jgi:signal transduction histidine kinase
VGWASGIPGATLKAAAGALVILHAALDTRSPHPLGALCLDGVFLCATAGLGRDIHGALVGAVAFVLAAALLLLPLRLVPVAITALGAGAGLRLLVFASPPGAVAGGTAGALTAGESAMYVIAFGLTILGAAHSVSLSRRRQDEALDSEQRAATMKNEFVSMVSHELRTPLTNIGGFAMALRESWRVFDPAEVDEFLGVICGETDHLRRLVDDVLVVPRLEVDRLLIEPVDFPLRPAAFRIADLVFPPGGAKTASVAIGGSAVVHADPNRVEQVLRNLLENAAKYGGTEVTVEAAARDDEWLVTVIDNGSGVDEEHRERIFAPFEQAVPSASPGNGLGLGLTVSRVLVEAMGGRIWYEPGFPTGSRFCFTLPAASSRQGAPMPAVP